MIRRLAAVGLLFMFLCATGFAQGIALDPTPPSRAQVLSLLAAMGVRQNVENSLRSAQARVKASAQAAFKKKYPNADAASVKKLDAVFDSTPLFGFEDISETVIAVYQKHLSAADVQAGIDFYRSDAGQRLVSLLPVIIRETNENSQQVVQQKLAAYSEEITRKLEAFQQEMEAKAPSGSERPNESGAGQKK